MHWLKTCSAVVLHAHSSSSILLGLLVLLTLIKIYVFVYLAYLTIMSVILAHNEIIIATSI